jgi:phosphatidylserine decarboxylase
MANAGAPIEYFNRYTGRRETEPVYGERWLRWTYETAPGRFALWLFVKRAWFSRHYGRKMSRPASARRIAPFIQQYGVDASEFLLPAESFRTFNDFFVRQLRPAVRPICGDPDAVVFPADGRHLGFADVGGTGSFYAKGQWLDVPGLLQDRELARRFERGAIVISRLCPLDYHRFHFPCAGRAGESRLLNGPLFSVSPIALRRSLDALAQNKRVLTVLEQTPAGRVVIVEIGATCVGSIVPTALPGPVRRGEEKGFFQFGGSCVITLFEPRRVELSADLLAHSAENCELYARMGDRMGTVLPAISAA